VATPCELFDRQLRCLDIYRFYFYGDAARSKRSGCHVQFLDREASACTLFAQPIRLSQPEMNLLRANDVKFQEDVKVAVFLGRCWTPIMADGPITRCSCWACTSAPGARYISGHDGSYCPFYSSVCIYACTSVFCVAAVFRRIKIYIIAYHA